jgi:hypothetical protein
MAHGKLRKVLIGFAAVFVILLAGMGIFAAYGLTVARSDFQSTSTNVVYSFTSTLTRMVGGQIVTQTVSGEVNPAVSEDVVTSTETVANVTSTVTSWYTNSTTCTIINYGNGTIYNNC